MTPFFCGSEFLHPQSHPVLQGQRWSLLGPCSLSAGGEDGEGPQMLEQSADWQCKSLCIIGRIEPSKYKMCIAFKAASLLQYYTQGKLILPSSAVIEVPWSTVTWCAFGVFAAVYSEAINDTLHSEGHRRYTTGLGAYLQSYSCSFAWLTSSATSRYLNFNKPKQHYQ